MSNVENLRKQAKQFVRWHRDRHWTVADVIRGMLPRYQQLSDHQIFEREFRLTDAQELIARRAGFTDWTALLNSASGSAEVSGSETASIAEPELQAHVLRARPFVFVQDIAKACAYYVDTLGFKLAFMYGEPAFYAEVERDEVRLCVRCVDAKVIDPALAKREQLVIASLEVRGVKALFLEFQSAGARFSQPLQHRPYGVREFIVDDLDGNGILFFEPQPQLPEQERGTSLDAEATR
jgi:uncharacterized glyoxalase superfamily protein PhnB